MRKFTRGRIERFIRTYATDKLVLDIGAGGVNYNHLFPNRTTLDIDPSRTPNIIGDAHALPFSNDEFEVVLCSEVFEHLKDPQKVVSEIRRVLKPNGLLVLTTRFAFPVHDAPGDYWRFTPYGLTALFKNWDMLELVPESGPFSTIAILLQRIIFQTDMRGGRLTKALLYVFARFFLCLDWLILQRYGNIQKTIPVDVLLTSGMYIACRNTK